MTRQDLERYGLIMDQIAVMQRKADEGAWVSEGMIALRREDLIEAWDMIDRYIDTLADSRIRLLITLKYVSLLSWEKVARAVPGETASSARRAVERHLDSVGVAV